MLPQGGWEGMGGAAASLGGGLVLEQPSLSSSCLSCPERVSGPGHSAAERQRLPRVPHLRGACESPTAEGACTPPRQSPAVACPVYCQPLRQEQTVADVYFVCYDQRAGPLTKWDHLLL